VGLMGDADFFWRDGVLLNFNSSHYVGLRIKNQLINFPFGYVRYGLACVHFFHSLIQLLLYNRGLSRVRDPFQRQ
jgi:hypothetical protein